MPAASNSAPSSAIAAVAFDLDGTLIDSREDLAAGVNAVRAELDLRPLPVARVVELIGKGSRHLVRRALPETVRGDEFERAYRRFLALYYDRCLERTRPYDGVLELLDALAAPGGTDGGGLPLAVVTNKPERHTAKVLEGLRLASRFRVVLGGDSLPRKKPDPAPLREAARRLEVPVERILFVGDSVTDGETARRAGCPLVLVGWGFGGRDELARFECVLRAERPVEIGDLLRRTWAR